MTMSPQRLLKTDNHSSVALHTIVVSLCGIVLDQAADFWGQLEVSEEVSIDSSDSNDKNTQIEFLQENKEGNPGDLRDSSKETISLDSGYDTPSGSVTSTKQDIKNKRIDVLRRYLLNSVITQTMRYNGRGLLFVFVYCITLSTLYPCFMCFRVSHIPRVRIVQRLLWLV